MNLNEDLFFVYENGFLIAWDYVKHTQHRLSLNAVKAILDDEFRRNNPEIEAELFSAQILVEQKSNKRPWSWDVLSRIFHMGTIKDKNNDKKSPPSERAWDYIKYCDSISKNMQHDFFSTERGITAFSIHDVPNRPDIGQLQSLLEKRRTNRRFSCEELSFSNVMTIIDEAIRYRSHDQDAYREIGLFTPTHRRSSPSGGSLQSCEAYLICKHISILEPGVYHFRSHSRTLGHISGLPQEFSFGELCGGQQFADELSAIIVLTCRFEKLMWKYKHSHAYRVALLDAGHLSQTIQLVATSLNIRTWVTGAFYDLEIKDILNISNEPTEYPLIIIGLGTGEPNPFDSFLERND